MKKLNLLWFLWTTFGFCCLYLAAQRSPSLSSMLLAFVALVGFVSAMVIEAVMDEFPVEE